MDPIDSAAVETISELIDATTTAPSPGESADELMRVVYLELRRLAAAMTAREKPGHTIQATDLVHEAYMRLVKNKDPNWNGRGHFFGAAAQAMRRILVEQARRKAALRHGGGRKRDMLDDTCIAVNDGDPTDIIALDEALDRLEKDDPRKAALVKLRHFTGMTIVQAAEVLGISHATAERYWTYSRARLYQWVQGQQDPSSK